MAVAMTLKFITTVALYLQLLTLVYLYSGNRARFFRYLVWAWGLFVVSKGSYIIQHFFPQAGGVIPLLNAAGSAGDLLILAAATFHNSGHPEVADIGDAYRLLTPLLGTTIASTLFAVALLASGPLWAWPMRSSPLC